MAAAAFTATMSAEDTVLWKLEQDPELRSAVTALALLDRPPDPERLRRRVELAVGALPRLRQRVVAPGVGWRHPAWVDVTAVDLDYHLRTVAAVADDPGWLLRFAATVAEVGFDRARPLWELTVVEGLPGGAAAIVQTVHHSLTDGIGAVEILLAMLDATRNPRNPPRLPHAASGRRPDGPGVLGRRAIDVATNVPGLPQRAYVAGAELRREYAFAPLSGAAVNISLVSHVASACVGLNMDRQAVQDPDGLTDCVAESFAELAGLGRRAPAGAARAGGGRGSR